MERVAVKPPYNLNFDNACIWVIVYKSVSLYRLDLSTAVFHWPVGQMANDLEAVEREKPPHLTQPSC
jgi:hypothetical protein